MTVDNSLEKEKQKQWHLFTGNELGVLLGYWQIKKWKLASLKGNNKNKVLMNVIVEDKFVFYYFDFL